MNILTFNAGLAAGVALLTAGAWTQWGIGAGLLVAGSLVLGLTFVVSWIGRS